jgi:uncharacterized repeat protein (TIGR01451 family)
MTTAVLTAAGLNVSGIEGAAIAAPVATFTDANLGATPADFSATITWGDGLQTAGTVVANSGGGFAVTGSHTYAEEGTYTTSVTIIDAGGSMASATSSATIADAALSAAGTAITGTEGAAFSGLVATFTDANPTAPVIDFTATITWGDGATSPGTITQPGGLGTGFIVSGAHTYAEEGNYGVSVAITDIGGSTANATSMATVADAALTAQGVNVAAIEGASTGGIVASFTDADPNAVASDFTATINWGDGASSTGTIAVNSNGGFDVIGTHSYAEEGTFPINVMIFDAGGSTANATSMATVADAALTAAGLNVSGIEGAAIAAPVATFTDANPTAPQTDFTATITWGDGATSPGTITQPGGIGTGFIVSGAHTYAEEGSHPVMVTVSDVGGSSASATGMATVALPADLHVTITDAATTLVPGTVDTYTIRVTNNGPNTVGSFTLTDAIPDALLNATFGTPSAGSYDPGSGLWSGLSLASGQSAFITLSGVIGIATGTLSNTVSVSPPAGLFDPNPGDNTATDTDTLTLFSSPYPPPPPATSANMILRRGDGLYAIYDLGNNATLAAHPLAQVGSDWQFAGLGSVQAGGGTAMFLRQQDVPGPTGSFEIYNISNNNVISAALLGHLNGQVQGIGNFGSHGENDVLLRDVTAFFVVNDQFTGIAPLGTVGINWERGGFGSFSGNPGEYDMLLRDTNSGGLQVYDIANNQITNSAFIGAVGLDWQISGFGAFSSRPGETDMIMRNSNTGGLQVYDIANNRITNSAFLGTVGLEWQFAGVAPIRGPGTSDLVLRNVNTGAFEAYDIANNQIIGAASLGRVGLEWQLGGFAADPAAASMGSSGSVSQLVQAMAGFGGGSGAAESLNTAPLGADTSQQPLLTTPQHA